MSTKLIDKDRRSDYCSVIDGDEVIYFINNFEVVTINYKHPSATNEIQCTQHETENCTCESENEKYKLMRICVCHSGKNTYKHTYTYIHTYYGKHRFSLVYIFQFHFHMCNFLFRAVCIVFHL